jgi:hypothetical protein
MALDLSRVEAAVERDNTVNQSAITLLTQLSQLVRDTAGDPAKVAALADALADAVAANTPAA